MTPTPKDDKESKDFIKQVAYEKGRIDDSFLLNYH